MFFIDNDDCRPRFIDFRFIKSDTIDDSQYIAVQNYPILRKVQQKKVKFWLLRIHETQPYCDTQRVSGIMFLYSLVLPDML